MTPSQPHAPALPPPQLGVGAGGGHPLAPIRALSVPAFRAAARALLLANHRGIPAAGPASANGGSGRQLWRGRRRASSQQHQQRQQQQVVRLPSAVVQRVLRLAAASLSAWLPPLPSCGLDAEL